MSLGSSSTMFTPSIAASRGSAPARLRSTALATARKPLALATARGPEGAELEVRVDLSGEAPRCAASARGPAAAAAATAEVRRFRREREGGSMVGLYQASQKPGLRTGHARDEFFRFSPDPELEALGIIEGHQDLPDFEN